jgi:ketosteroid isomerase-like protein
MKTTREVAQRYMDLLCAQKFDEAFELIAEKGTYTLIGTTPLSRTFQGRAEVKATLVPALATFRVPPKLTLREIIVDGNRAVSLASGEGVGPTGLPYSQPHYAMVMSIENGQIQSVVEFMDTVAVETALVGNKLVPA